MTFPDDKRLYVVTWLTDFSYSLFLFTLTRYLAEHGGDPMQLGIAGACNALTYALGAAFFGHISDRIGTRLLIAIGACILTLMFTMALYSLALPFLYVYFFLSGLGTALIFPPIIVLVAAGQPSGGGFGRAATRPLILFCVSWNLGVLCGQSGGGFLFDVNPELALKLGVGSSLAILLLIVSTHVRPLGDVSLPISDREALPGPASVRLRVFAAAGWLANISGASALSLIHFIFPKLVTDLGINAAVHGMMLTTGRIFVFGVYFLLHFTTFWRHRLLPAVAAQIIGVVSLLLLTYGSTVAVLTAGLTGLGVMMGYNYFASMFYSTTSFSSRRVGLASGIHQGSMAIGFTAGSLGGGYLSLHSGIRVPYQVCIAILLCSLLFQVLGYLWVHGWRGARSAAP